MWHRVDGPHFGNPPLSTDTWVAPTSSAIVSSVAVNMVMQISLQDPALDASGTYLGVELLHHATILF